MNKPLIFLDDAVEEGRHAWKWYEDRSRKAAQRFQDALVKGLEEIHENPARWPTYLHATQYYPIRRFPYLIVYRETPSSIEILAIAHAHRKEGYWKRRLE
jgi:plasmid stabilization system protein ParE